MKYKKLSVIGLLAVLALATLMFSLHIITGPAAFALVGLYQLAMLARSKPRPGVFYMAVLSNDQVDEFSQICTELGEHMTTVKTADARLKLLEKDNDEMRGELKKLKKNGFLSPTGVRWMGDVPFVSSECAAAITSIIVMDAASQKRLDSMIPDNAKRERILQCAQGHLGLQQRAGGALNTGDIPLPTIYVPQVIELVFAYGQARKFATVFPMGSGTVKLPRLQPGEDTFGFLGAGTAGQSQNIPQKEVAAALVTFTANKFGGLIRIPYELEVDTFIPIGQFLARYIARQFAKMEDTCLFNADGSATYAGIIGIAKYCSTPVGGQTPYLTQLAAGQTVPSDANLAAFRAMRANVNPAVLVNMAANGQTQAAYVPKLMRAHRQTARPGEPHRFEQSKVLVKDTSSDFACTYETGEFYVKDVLIVIPSEENPSSYDLRFVAGVINSKALHFYYRTTFQTIHVQNEELASLPLPFVNFADDAHLKRHNEVVSLVEQMLKAQKQLASAHTDRDKDFYGGKCESLDRQIDALVYELYGLTDDEIKIVEGAVK